MRNDGQEQTLGVRLIEVSVKKELTVHEKRAILQAPYVY